MALHPSDVLVRPVITEKNTNLTPLGQYTFEVDLSANKIQIKEAVEKTFDVTVLAVNTMIVKPKKRRVFRARNTARFGKERTIKKAIVGAGHADKTQIAFMVRRLLPTAGDVSADAADALGVALCHAAHGGFRRRAGA